MAAPYLLIGKVALNVIIVKSCSFHWINPWLKTKWQPKFFLLSWHIKKREEARLSLLFSNFKLWHLVFSFWSPVDPIKGTLVLFHRKWFYIHSNSEELMYSCSKITTIWIQISRQNRNGIFSNISPQIIV